MFKNHESVWMAVWVALTAGFFCLDGWYFVVLLLGYPLLMCLIPVHYVRLDRNRATVDEAHAFVSSVLFQLWLGPWFLALMTFFLGSEIRTVLRSFLS